MTARPHIENLQTPGVPLLDLRETEVMEALRKVCAGQKFIAYVAELEKRVAEYSQRRFGIGISSGTDALPVALMGRLKKRLIDVKVGTEVYYPGPLHSQQCFDYMSYGRRIAPNRTAPHLKRPLFQSIVN